MDEVVGPGIGQSQGVVASMREDSSWLSTPIDLALPLQASKLGYVRSLGRNVLAKTWHIFVCVMDSL